MPVTKSDARSYGRPRAFARGLFQSRRYVGRIIRLANQSVVGIWRCLQPSHVQVPTPCFPLCTERSGKESAPTTFGKCGRGVVEGITTGGGLERLMPSLFIRWRRVLAWRFRIFAAPFGPSITPLPAEGQPGYGAAPLPPVWAVLQVRGVRPGLLSGVFSRFGAALGGNHRHEILVQPKSGTCR